MCKQSNKKGFAKDAYIERGTSMHRYLSILIRLNVGPRYCLEDCLLDFLHRMRMSYGSGNDFIFYSRLTSLHPGPQIGFAYGTYSKLHLESSSA